jgi:hypothetical protein
VGPDNENRYYKVSLWSISVGLLSLYPNIAIADTESRKKVAVKYGKNMGREGYLTEICLSPLISPSFLGAAPYISPQKRDPRQSLHIAIMSVGTYSFKIATKLSSRNQSNVE